MPFIYDIDAACGTSTYGGTDKMHNCLFLLEGLGFFESGSGTSGYWLFDFPTWREHDVYFVSGKQRHVSYTVANNSSGNVGVRPVLMLLKDNIESSKLGGNYEEEKRRIVSSYHNFRNLNDNSNTKCD